MKDAIEKHVHRYRRCFSCSFHLIFLQGVENSIFYRYYSAADVGAVSGAGKVAAAAANFDIMVIYTTGSAFDGLRLSICILIINSMELTIKFST